MSEVARNFEFSIHYQRSVLSRILQDRPFALVALKILRYEHFDTEAFRWIYRKIDAGMALTPHMLVSELKIEIERELVSKDLAKAIAKEAKTFIGKKDFDDAKYGLDKLRDFIDTQELSEGLLIAASKLKDGENPSRIKNRLKKLLVTRDSDEIQTENIISTRTARYQRREEKVNSGDLIFVPTGIEKLDRIVHGPAPGDVWSWFGDTNIGKSALAVNIGRVSFILGFKTWHIVLEDKFEMTCQRYDTSITKTQYDKLTFCNYNDKEKKRAEKIFEVLEKKRGEHVYVSKIEEGCTMVDIEQEYDHVRESFGFQPFVVLIDSPHCMEPALRRESTRLNYKQIYQEIRKFTRRERVVMHLFDQSKQEVKNKIADTSASSESYDKARIVDGFITINQTKIEKKEGIMKFFVAKMKDHDKNFEVLVRPRLEIMRYESVGE